MKRMAEDRVGFQAPADIDERMKKKGNKTIVGGKAVSNEELQRVDEVFFGLIAFCFDTGMRSKSDEGDLYQKIKERVDLSGGNSLTKHMAERFEIKEYVNKFHMIEPINKKNHRGRGEHHTHHKTITAEEAYQKMSSSRVDKNTGGKEHSAIMADITKRSNTMIGQQQIAGELYVSTGEQEKVKCINLDIQQNKDDKMLREKNQWEEAGDNGEHQG